MAPRLRSAVVRFDALPEPVFRILFLALPVDERARAACVCRSWRAFLADPSLWQVLDLTPAGGVAAARVTENLVRGAVARAAGYLRVFRLSRAIRLNALLIDVIVNHGAELEEVEADVFLRIAELGSRAAVFAAAPRLQALDSLVGQCTALLPFLRNDPPHPPLRVRELAVHCGGAQPADVLAFAAALIPYEPLKCLNLLDVEFARGLNALVDAATERRVHKLVLRRCVSDVETVPALARLLQRGSLTKLEICACPGFPLAQEASTPVLCTALRACRTLKRLEFGLNPPDGASRRVVEELLDAATALPVLSELDLSFSEFQDKGHAGRSLGALLAANMPSLHTLRMVFCPLGDEGMTLLLGGLAENTHLRKLNCVGHNLSEAFTRDRLEPALAALAARAYVAHRWAE
jgi:hypothetical protein